MVSNVAKSIVDKLIEGVELDWPETQTCQYYRFMQYAHLLGLHDAFEELQRKRGKELYKSEFFMSLACNLFYATGVRAHSEKKELMDKYKARMDWLVAKGQLFVKEIYHAWQKKVEEFGVLTGVRVMGNSPEEYETSAQAFLEPNFVNLDSYSENDRYPNLFAALQRHFPEKKYTLIELGSAAGHDLLALRESFQGCVRSGLGSQHRQGYRQPG